MTVTYTSSVSRVRLLGFPRLLRAWRGSVYKLLYREMLIYCVAFASISLLYRFILTQTQRESFEKLVIYVDTFSNLIPVTFILGFYITLIVGRWWNQYLNIPWPDKLITYIGAHMKGSTDDSRILRRTLVRYVILSLIIIFQSISPSVKKRFPSIHHLTCSGIMTPAEEKLYESLPSAHHKYWVPMQWASTLLARARQANLIADDISFNVLLDEVIKYRRCLGMLYSFDWISLPLVYTQVTTISMYVFFFSSLIGRQFIPPDRVKEILGHASQDHIVDTYIPLFTICQLFFYLGLLKTAESMINPFGEDDDDFEVNWIIDRNLQVGLLSVDHMYNQLPPLEKDRFWDVDMPVLPYTRAAQHCYASTTWLGSVAGLDVNPAEPLFVPTMPVIIEDCILTEESSTQLFTPGNKLTSTESIHQYSGIKSPSFDEESHYVETALTDPSSPIVSSSHNKTGEDKESRKKTKHHNFRHRTLSRSRNESENSEQQSDSHKLPERVGHRRMSENVEWKLVNPIYTQSPPLFTHRGSHKNADDNNFPFSCESLGIEPTSREFQLSNKVRRDKKSGSIIFRNSPPQYSSATHAPRPSRMVSTVSHCSIEQREAAAASEIVASSQPSPWKCKMDYLTVDFVDSSSYKVDENESSSSPPFHNGNNNHQHENLEEEENDDNCSISILMRNTYNKSNNPLL